MKLIYIFTTRVVASYEKQFGMCYFRKKGWEIEIFDMSPIITPAAYERIKTGIYTGNDLRLFYSKQEYRKYLKTVKKDTVFICHDYNRLDTQFLFSALKNHTYGFVWNGSSTVTVGKDVKRLLKWDLKRVLNSVYIRLPHIIQRIPPAAFIAMSGVERHERLKSLAGKDKNTIIKYIHVLDFEDYLQARDKKERLIPEKYCVFIDEYMGYHPDNKDFGISYTQREIDLYYTEIRGFFHYIEKTTGLKVIIALHPRADFSKHPECYKDFTALRFKTAELIKDCEFVIAHYSAALSYVALFHKPCISIETTMIKATPIMNRAIKDDQKRFRLPSIDISNEQYQGMDIRDYLKVDYEFLDEFIRKYYCKDYIDENTAIKPLWEQIETCILDAVEKRGKFGGR